MRLVPGQARTGLGTDQEEPGSWFPGGGGGDSASVQPVPEKSRDASMLR